MKTPINAQELRAAAEKAIEAQRNFDFCGGNRADKLDAGGESLNADQAYFKIANPTAILSLLADLEAAERDAQRYQILKSLAYTSDTPFEPPYWVLPETGGLGETFDAAIDSLRKD